MSGNRYGKSLMMMNYVKLVIDNNKKLFIATANVDALYDKLKLEFPKATFVKEKAGVRFEP